MEDPCLAIRALQGIKLTLYHAFPHEVALASPHAFEDQRLIAIQEQEADRLVTLADLVAVLLLEGGADDDTHLVLLFQAVGRIADPLQPGGAILIVERGTTGHLLDVGFRVQIIAIDELGPQCLGHLETDAGLAAATHSHHDNALTRHNLTSVPLFKKPAADGF